MAAYGAGVLGLLCLSSSVYAAMSGGGGEETPAQITVVPDTETETKTETEAEAAPAALEDPKVALLNAAVKAGGVKGQYVRLWQGQPYQTQDAYALNILELEVYDNSGTNIARGKTATSSSQYPGDHQPVLAFDGSLDTKYRSNYDVEEDWLEVDLGSVIDIHKIVIKHTGSEDVYEGVAMKDGLRGYIEIFDGNGSVGKTTQIGVTSTDDVYTYNFKERGGGKWRGGQGIVKSREDIIAKKQAADAAAADVEKKRLAALKKAIVPGHSNAEKTYWKNIQNTPTPEDCRLEAAKKGIPTFIHRNSTHSGMPNSCQLNVWSDQFAGDARDTVHTQGCTYGGTPQNGCTPWPSVMGYGVPGRKAVGPDEMGVMDPNECIELGKAKGADVWGYRTKNHGSAPNSCFFFTGTSAFRGDENDKAHIVGCINGKDIKYGCA